MKHSESTGTSGYTSYLHKKKLFPENPTYEEAQAVASIEAMRKAIKEHAFHSPLVLQAFEMAHHQGLDENDMMVVLAFHAVAASEHLEERLLDMVHRSPNPFILRHGV
jgi:hypothetical protein